MNAWTTTIISGLVFVVTFMQWRTAHTRILLDLFDKRSVAYNGVVDSMLSTFMSGDMVVADTSFPRRDDLPDDGEMYVISKDGELLVKRALWIDVGVLEWKSDNPEFAAIRVEGDEINRVKIIGKVVWLWRRTH